LQKVNIGFVTSVSPSVSLSTWNNLASNGQILMTPYIMDFH